MNIRIKPFLRGIDLLGAFFLALQGAATAAGRGLDLLGVLTVALVSAMAGGMIRDVLIGAHPVEALRGWRMLGLALCGGLLAFLAHSLVARIPETLLLLIDAAGLSLLAVAGAEKGLEYGLKGPSAVLMGGLTGVGGGTLRDVLLNEIPAVLRVDFVASSALAGAGVLVIARYFKLRAEWPAILGGLTCFGLRLLSGLYHWNLPTAPG